MKRNPYINKTSDQFDLCILELDHYELECYYFFDLSEPLLYVWDFRNSLYNLVGDFFRFNWDEESICDELIPDIERLIANGLGDEVFIGELVNAYVQPDKLFLSDKADMSNVKIETEGDAKAIIETKNFLQISKLWSSFLTVSKHRKSKYNPVNKDLPRSA